jgi:hypothetical protein
MTKTEIIIIAYRFGNYMTIVPPTIPRNASIALLALMTLN